MNDFTKIITELDRDPLSSTERGVLNQCIKTIEKIIKSTEITVKRVDKYRGRFRNSREIKQSLEDGLDLLEAALYDLEEERDTENNG